MAAPKKQRINFTGNIKEDSLVVGSHGDVVITVDGNFDLSGIIYCPKYNVTLVIKGEGKVSFRGKCNRVIIKKMEGICTLDLSDLTCKELRCEAIRGQTTVITGKTRVITQANLSDEAILHIAERPLITNAYTTGSSKIVRRGQTITDVIE